MNKLTKIIFSGILFASGIYAICKYTNVPKWLRKSFLNENTNNIDGSIKVNKFPLIIGSKKDPEVGVVQLSLGMPLTGTLNSDDFAMFHLKYIQDLEQISENDYILFFKNNEDAFKTQLDAFYKHLHDDGI